jgi:hypothetical protein
MYYVETRADNSGYTNQSIPSFKWIPLIVFEKWTLTKKLTENLTDPDADAGVTTIA